MTQPPDPDDLDWNPEEHGRMADFATPADEEPLTEPYAPDDTETD